MTAADLTDPDHLAGVVDLFGALTRAELGDAVGELAFKRGDDLPEDVLSDAVDAAVREYYLVACPAAAVGGDVTAAADGSAPEDELLAVGPVAFPTLPEGAADLPHILDVSTRSVDRDALVRGVETRLRGDAARAVNDGDEDRVAHLLDVTYDLEAWASVDVSEVRDRLDAACKD